MQWRLGISPDESPDIPARVVPDVSADVSPDISCPPVPGDEFALHGEGIYCKEDHELAELARAEDNNNHKPALTRIKHELEDFRDNLSDLGREEDSYRSVLIGL